MDADGQGRLEKSGYGAPGSLTPALAPTEAKVATVDVAVDESAKLARIHAF